MELLRQTPFQQALKRDFLQFPGNLGALLDVSNENYPDRCGIAVPGEQHTFREYHDRVCRMVNGLRTIGLERNDRVVFISGNTINWAIISLAVFRMGAILVPLNPRIQHYELVHILSETQPKLVIGESRGIQAAHNALERIRIPLSPTFITLDEKLPSTAFIQDLKFSESVTHCEEMAAEDTAMIVYSVEKDGYSLGSILSHGSIFYDAVSVVDRAFHQENIDSEVLACGLPLFHCYGFTTGFIVPLLGSVTCVLINLSLGGKKIASILESFQVTTIFSVPAIYQALFKPLSESLDTCSRFRNVTSGGIAIPMEILKAYQKKLGVCMSEGYGLTETAPVITWNGMDPPPKHGTVGCPLSCCEVKIVDNNGRELHAGQDGEVLTRGLNLFTGYLNQPEYTKSLFLDDWFRTGDIGHLDNEGYLTLTGLKKDMINIMGLKVYPNEVERILMYHPHIQTAHIWQDWDQKFGNIVAAEIGLKPGSTMNEREFQNWCRQNISPYKIPRKIQIHTC